MLKELIVLSVEKDFLNEIKYNNLIDNFASQKVGKINFNYFIKVLSCHCSRLIASDSIGLITLLGYVLIPC